jgi:O-antigen/teichoic acid export membrane protein
MSILDRVRSVLDGATPFWKESLVYLGGNLVNAALPVALMPILTRYLSPTDYGIVATSAVLVQFLSVAMSLNSSGLIVSSQFEENRETQRKLVSTNLLLAFALATLLGLWALGAGDLVERATEFPAAWSPAVVLLALTSVIQATYLCLLQARKETTRYVSLQVLSTGLNLGLSLALVAALRMNWQGRILAMLAAGMVIAGICLHGLVSRLKVLGLTFGRDSLKALVTFGMPLIPHFLGGWVMTMAPRLFLNKLATVADTGLYSVAFNLASPIAMIAGAANQAYMPALFERLSRPESLDKFRLSRVLLLGAAGLLAMAVVYGLTIRLLLPHLVGPRFYASTNYVLWLSLAFAVQGVYFIFANFVVYARRTSLLAWRADFLAGLSAPVLLPLLIRHNGPIGAAQVTFIAFTISCLGGFTASRKAFSMPWAQAARSFAELYYK